MVPSDEPNAALDPGFFDGRLLVEILTWDWHFNLRVSDRGFPKKYRFQGGLNYVRGFEVEGRVVAPVTQRDRRMRLWLSPFGPEMKFDIKSLDGVGHVYRHDPPKYGADLTATMLIPESSIGPVATCLASIWKYAHIWTFEEEAEIASVSSFSFSRDLHKNLLPWISGEAS